MRNQIIAILIFAILGMAGIYTMFALTSHFPDRITKDCQALAQQYPQYHVKSRLELDYQIGDAECVVTDDLSKPWIPVQVNYDKNGVPFMVRW